MNHLPTWMRVVDGVILALVIVTCGLASPHWWLGIVVFAYGFWNFIVGREWKSDLPKRNG